MNRLKAREKYMLSVALGFIGIFVIAQVIVFPVLDKRARLERVIEAKTRILSELQVLAAEFNTIKQRSDVARKRITEKKKGFTLFSFLDRVAGETRLKDRIAYMKPSFLSPKDSPYKISLVEMKLQTITLEQLVLYLHKIETDENAIHIKRISIVKTGKARGHINAVMEIDTEMRIGFLDSLCQFFCIKRVNLPGDCLNTCNSLKARSSVDQLNWGP